MSDSVRFAAAVSRAWVRLYTARLPEALRDSRRAEIDADLWEHQSDHLAANTPARAAVEILLRTGLGALDDMGWRFDVLRALGSSNHGRIPMLAFSSQQRQWMGLAGLAGGLLWVVDLLFFMQRRRAHGPGVLDIIVGVSFTALLLIGLFGFLAHYRGRVGRKGTIGIFLLIAAMASLFLLNTLGTLPGAKGNVILGVLGVAFALLPIPAFILIGLALKGPARLVALVIGILGPLTMILPRVLSRYVSVDPQWLRGDSPVGLTYFIVTAVWLAAAGYSTFRQAQAPRKA